ncbi:GNAT family N-acetyltransferase [Bordetella holmesii]|uniref:Acetyltransferase (GNAT) domain protein n=2 Tax=Bordetella holmesii TaxID=35814 RepID=A0A158M066_9BORD|nr:GNAT family N-acetyltransferase [Bordetella holmesii]AHV91677.1 acetyltransferase family protein [Bordetella holmesii ATCC 51541]AIT27925.1 acetyltransferase family protein [Bordetella holmesii 44057]EWM40703.1 acetyltransferase family protein [Bordetella holmesii 35009]EWM43134.1 acetyltransferase family protein [Bordetella holmesii 41130]EWM44599.1 acetyltransferase family protein [Bordetella holmesii 70147]
MFQIEGARFPQDRDALIAIIREYISSTRVSLEYQHYDEERDGLSGKYARPRGLMLLARKAGAVVGCGGFREIDATTCEMKRVYVRPEARGQQLDRQLMERILDEARAAGYRRICLDVLPEFLAAQYLYESLGFHETPPVTQNLVPGSRSLGRDL